MDARLTTVERLIDLTKSFVACVRPLTEEDRFACMLLSARGETDTALIHRLA